jgi:hypothetical protein
MSFFRRRSSEYSLLEGLEGLEGTLAQNTDFPRNGNVKYPASTITPSLTRKITGNLHGDNYNTLLDFFNNMTDDTWYVAGLFTSMFDTHTFQIPVYGFAASVNRHLKSGRCKKLIICKKISSNRIVAIINISDSVKENRYLNKLIFIRLQPSGATVHVIDTLNPLDWSSINFNDFERTIANSGLHAIDPNVVTHDTQIRLDWSNINTIGDLDELYKKYVPDSAQTAQTAGNRFKKITYKIRKHNNTRKIKTKYRNRRHKKRY